MEAAAIDSMDDTTPAGLAEFLEEHEQLKVKIQDLEAENESLKHGLNIIKQYVEAKLGPIPPEEHFSESLKAYEGQRERNHKDHLKILDLNDQIDNEIIPAIKLVQSRAASSTGKTTAKRVKEIEALLKNSNGSLSFKAIRGAMGLKANQLNRLVNALDQRKFSVASKPGSPREKVLRIKVRWS